MPNASFVLPALGDAKTQVRLLTIQTLNEATRGARGAPGVIRANVSVHDTRGVAGTYVAVSYTWGTASTSNILRLCQKSITVGANCWYALWQMCHFRFKHMPMIWVDSVCIDQASEVERADQVQQMGAIYKGSGMVAACIGEGGYTSQLWRKGDWYQREHIREMEETRAYCDLISRPYFKRLWTVQEVLLSRRTHVFCGASHVPMRDLHERLRKRLYEAGTSPRAKNHDLRDDEIEEFIALCAGYRTEFRADSEFDYLSIDHSIMAKENRYTIDHQHVDKSRDLADLILRYSRRKCSEPRDTIYGLLSLSSAACNQLHPRVRYDVPLLEVLLDYAATHKRLQASTLVCYDPTAGSLFKMAKSIHTLFDKFSEAIPEFGLEVNDFLQSHQCALTQIDFFGLVTDLQITLRFDMVTIHRFTPIEVVNGESVQSRTDHCSYCLQRSPTYSGRYWGLRCDIRESHPCYADRTYESEFKRVKLHVGHTIDLLFDVPCDTQPVDFLISNHRQSTTDQIYLVCRQFGLRPEDFIIIGTAYHVASPDARFSTSFKPNENDKGWEFPRWFQITFRLPSACLLHHVLASENVPDLLKDLCTATGLSNAQVEVRNMDVKESDTLLIRNLKGAASKSCFFIGKTTKLRTNDAFLIPETDSTSIIGPQQALPTLNEIL